MSTDSEMPARRVRDRPRGARRFRRRLVSTLVVLALVAGGAAVIGAGQGPRLSRIAYSGTDLVTQAAQRVILYANQSVSPVRASDVTVSPRAAFTVSTSGNAIALQFTGPLRYDHAYSVQVRDVTAAGRSVASTLTTSFTTGSTSVLSLLPGRDGAPDRVVRRPLAASGNTVLYSGNHITGFQRLGRYLVILRTNAERRSSIDLVPIGSGQIEHIQMPTSNGTATALHVADDGAAFGFVYAAVSGGQTTSVGLYVVSLSGTHVPMPVLASGSVSTNASATPGGVAQWGFVPRTESALVRTGDNDLLLVDTTGTARAVRLGTATYIHGFIGTGTTAVVESGAGLRKLDLATGKTRALPVPRNAVDMPYLGRIAALTPSSYLRVVGSFGTDGTIDAELLRVSGTTASRLPVVIGAGSITALCPSPNSEYVAVLTRRGDDTAVVIADARSGAVESTLDGATVDWCGAVPTGPDDN